MSSPLCPELSKDLVTACIPDYVTDRKIDFGNGFCLFYFHANFSTTENSGWNDCHYLQQFEYEMDNPLAIYSFRPLDSGLHLLWLCIRGKALPSSGDLSAYGCAILLFRPLDSDLHCYRLCVRRRTLFFRGDLSAYGFKISRLD